MQLRSYQQLAVTNSLTNLEQHGSVCLISPTGSGKTVMAEATASQYKRVLWTNGRKDLLRQAKERLSHTNIVVCSINKLERLGFDPELVVSDECHHGTSRTWRKILELYPKAYRLGLTATPQRADGAPLGDIYKSLVVAATYSELIASGDLTPCLAYRPTKDIENGLALDPVYAYKKYGQGKTGFAYVTNIVDAQNWQTTFSQAGISTCIINNKTKDADRKTFLDRLARGEIKLVINCSTMIEGIDVPSASVCLLGRRCEYEGIFIQIGGRILRPSEGKRYGVLVDLVGATIRHGLPTDDRQYGLEGTAIRRSEKLGSLRQCWLCGAVMASSAKKCITCATEFVPGVHRPPKIHNVELVAVYNGSETPEYAKVAEFTRLADKGTRFSGVKKSFEALFGHSPPQKYWTQLPQELINKEWKATYYKLKNRLGTWKAAGAASEIIKNYTGEYPSWQLRNMV